MKAIVKSVPIHNTEWKKGFVSVEREEPKIIFSNDVKIKVLYGAICGTDVGIYNSKDSLRREMENVKQKDVVVGHEFCGQIVEFGNRAEKILKKKVLNDYANNKLVQKFFANKNQKQNFIGFLNKNFFSTAEMHITDNTCYQCKLNEKHVCQNTVIKGIHDDGAFAEYVVIPIENIVLFLKNEIDPKIIAFMDAFGNATHTVQSIPVKNKTVVVLGCGVQGLMAIAVAKVMGAKKIFVSDASHESFSHNKLLKNRFKFAKHFGADECFDVSISKEKKLFYKKVFSSTQNAGADAVFEMSGSYKAYEDAFSLVRSGGGISLLGLPFGKMEIDFAKDIIFKGVTIHGVIGRRVFETWDLMRKILKKDLVKKLLKSGFISHILPLEEFEKAFTLIKNGDGLKVLLKP